MFLFVLLACFVSTFGSECEKTLGGACYSTSSTCPEMYNGYTLNYCGFLQQCCYHVAESSPSPSGAQTCGVSAVSSSHRIMGGSRAKQGEFPWQVSIRYDHSHICGGAFVDDRHILTAAHCLTDLREDSDLDSLTVLVGATDSLHWHQAKVHAVDSVVLHRDYNTRTFINDIALIRLDKAVDLSGSDVRAACLPDGEETFEGWTCTVTGWGDTSEDGFPPRYLRKVDLPVISNTLCSYYLGSGARIGPKNICAGFEEGGHDACAGDSGGPLVCQKGGAWQLAGVVSTGYGCGQPQSPGIYTRVSAYVDWIAHTVTHMEAQ